MLDFLSTHVRLDGDCRIWAGCLSHDNTTKVSWNRKAYNAQRLLLTLLGKSPKARVWATCDNRTCMNPDHLTTGTIGQHNQWMFDTGILPKGRSRAVAIALSRTPKLGIRAVPQLHKMRAEGLTYVQIGERLGVHPSAVGHLLRRWA